MDKLKWIIVETKPNRKIMFKDEHGNHYHYDDLNPKYQEQIREEIELMNFTLKKKRFDINQ